MTRRSIHAAVTVAAGLLVFTFFSTQLPAQTLYGTLVGNITDPSGLPVVGATVRAQHSGTGLARDLKLARITTAYPADGDYVFGRDKDGLPPGPSYLTRMLGVSAARAGVDLAGGAWHRLRASAISRWLRAGMSPLLAARLAGHADTKLVMDVYGSIEGVSERLEAAAFTALAPVEELLPSGPDEGA